MGACGLAGEEPDEAEEGRGRRRRAGRGFPVGAASVGRLDSAFGHLAPGASGGPEPARSRAVATGARRPQRGQGAIGPINRGAPTWARRRRRAALRLGLRRGVLEPLPAVRDRLGTCLGRAEEGAQRPVHELNEAAALAVGKIVPVAVESRELQVEVGQALQQRVLIGLVGRLAPDEGLVEAASCNAMARTSLSSSGVRNSAVMPRSGCGRLSRRRFRDDHRARAAALSSAAAAPA